MGVILINYVNLAIVHFPRYSVVESIVFCIDITEIFIIRISEESGNLCSSAYNIIRTN
jgi:hypothetical protein